MRFLIAFFVLAMSCLSAEAAWYTTVEDDIFSGGQKAVMLGDIGYDAALVFDCTKDSASVGYIEKGEWKEGFSDLEVRMIVKIDDKPPLDLTAIARSRNSEYYGFFFDDKDVVSKLASDIGEANSKILVGLEQSSIDMKWSGTVPVSGSTKAARQFLEACGLEPAKLDNL